RRRARRNAFSDRRPDETTGTRANHRPQRGFRRERIIQPIPTRQRDEAVDERIVDVAMHVDALDRATGLARVEIRTVDEIFYGRVQRRIRAHVRRILSAELQVGPDELPRRCALHGESPLDRPGERYELDAAIANHSLDVLVAG